MLQLRASSLADTHSIASAVAALSRPGDVIVLAGEMGAGKTAFAQGFGRSLGVTEPITSPTFTLVHSYDLPAGRATRMLHHADLYRLDRTGEVADLALDELVEFGGILLVEWGDVVEGVFADHLTVLLERDLDDSAPDDDDAEVLSLDGKRVIDIAGTGQSWAARWDRLRETVAGFSC